jgi:hypothetical protein
MSLFSAKEQKMNQDELIEKCRLTDEEIMGLEHRLWKEMPCFADEQFGEFYADIKRAIAQAQLRKAIPIIYKEGYKQGVADSDKAEKLDVKAIQKAEKERILGKMQCLRTRQFGDLWYLKPSVYEALKGEGDE